MSLQQKSSSFQWQRIHLTAGKALQQSKTIPLASKLTIIVVLPWHMHGLTKHRIKNPLIGIPKAQLLQDIDEFAAQYGVEDVKPWIIKGALVAQSPHHIDNIAELDDEDRRVLREEKTHKWKHPRTLYMTIIMVNNLSLSALFEVPELS